MRQWGTYSISVIIAFHLKVQYLYIENQVRWKHEETCMQEIKLSNNALKCKTCSTHLSDPSLMSLSRAAAAGECDFCKSSCCIFSSAALWSVYTLYIVVGLVLHILPNAKHGVHSSSRHCSTTDNRNKKARAGRISPPSIHRVALYSSQGMKWHLFQFPTLLGIKENWVGQCRNDKCQEINAWNVWFWGFGVVQLPILATLVLSGSGHSETIVLVVTQGFHSYMHKQHLVGWNKSKSKSSVDPAMIVLVARLEPVMQIQLLLGDPTTKGSFANLHFSGFTCSNGWYTISY